MSDAKIVALGFFKDWSNYLLVTSVAALGWVSTKSLGIVPWMHTTSIVMLSASVVFGMFTLALIPLIAQKMKDETTFYDVTVEAAPFLIGSFNYKIKNVCWPQHVTFILGIALYAYGVITADLPVETSLTVK